MDQCSICGQLHHECQTWSCGFGRRVSGHQDGGHFEKDVWVSPARNYGDVRYGKLVVCRSCENATRLLYEMEKKRSIAWCWITILALLMVFSIFSFFRPFSLPALVLLCSFLTATFFLAFKRLPPKLYPYFEDSEPIDLKEPLKPLDNIVRTVKGVADVRNFYIWGSQVQDIIKQRVVNPKPMMRAAVRMDEARLAYFAACARKLVDKGKIYQALMHTVLFKNRIPTPESLMVLGYIYERIGRLRDAFSAYKIASWLVEENGRPEAEAARLLKQHGGMLHRQLPMDEKTAAICALRYKKFLIWAEHLLRKDSRIGAVKAGKLLWPLLILNDPEGLSLYARALENRHLTDAARKVHNILSEAQDPLAE